MAIISGEAVERKDGKWDAVFKYENKLLNTVEASSKADAEQIIVEVLNNLASQVK